MKTSRLFLGLAALALIASGCSDNPAGLAPPTQPSAAIDVNDPRGELVVEVRYGGSFYDASNPTADNDCQLLVDLQVPPSGRALSYCEQTWSTIINPETYSVRTWIYDGYSYPTLENSSVTVTAGQTTTEVYELSEVTGIVTGAVIVDGQPATSSYRVCLSTGGCTNFRRGDGTFRLLTKPGDGEGVIWNDLNVELGRFTYTAQLGATVTVPDQSLEDPRSHLTVEVRYNGALRDASNPTADNDCQLLVDLRVPPSGRALSYCEQSWSTVVVPGSYSVRTWMYDGHMYPTLARSTITLADGEEVTRTYELTEVTGIVTGTVVVDGEPASSGYRVCLSTGGCTNFPRGDGTFRLLTKPGDGEAVVRNNTGTELGRFTYTALLGETVALPEQSMTDPRGDLTVEVRYNGALHDASNPTADNDCQLLVDLRVPPSGRALSYCERSWSTTVNADTYPVRSWIYDGYAYPTLENSSVTVTAGQTTTAVYDLSEVTGVVTGTVIVDGQPASSRYRVCLTTGGCSNFPSGDGSFRLITKPGQGEGVIWNDIGVELGRFTYGVEAGEETPMGTIGSNQPPVAHAGGPYTGHEGAAIAFDGSASSDPDGDVLSYGWDFDGDGVVDATGARPSHAFADDGVYTIRLTVSDGNGESDAQTASVTVANVAPSASFGDTGPVDEGSAFTISLSSPTDPSSVDVAAGFQYAFDCGAGSGYGAYGASAKASCSTADDGTRAVRGKIRDKDGGEREYSASVVVENVAPSVQIDSGAEILQGERYASAGSFADPGADTWTAVAAFGDATGEQSLALAGMSFELSHTYHAAGSFAARATVTDDDGGSGSAEATVVVLSPQQATRKLLGRIAQLAESGVLRPGEAQALSAKLNAAIGQMDAGRVAPVAGQIGAFQNQVSALVGSGRLPSATGQELIDYAGRILRSAQSSL